jgi:pyruvate carboxylase subunit B
MKDYFLPMEAIAVDPMIPWSPMPGGALTANTQMLRDNGIMDKYPDIIKAMSEVVERGGFGTSVTPVSQFYFQQAFNNVMMGPWKKIADGYGRMVLGYFGKTPAPPDPKIVEIASEQFGIPPNDRPVRELDDNDPKKGTDAARTKLQEAGLEETDENIFIVAACGDKGMAFLKGEGEVGVRKEEPEKQQLQATPETKPDQPQTYQVSVNGKSYNMTIDGDTATVNGKVYNIGVKVAKNERKPVSDSNGAPGTPVTAQIPGKVISVVAQSGQTVQEGEIIIVLEAMKMEMEITAPVSGTVNNITVNTGDQIIAGQTLAIIY